MISNRHLQDKVEIISKCITFCFPEMSILPSRAPAQRCQAAAPASSLLAPRKQPLPLSPPFSVSLRRAPVGDAADRAVAEPLEAGRRWWWCPHGSYRMSHGCCAEVWLLQVISPSSVALYYPTAAPMISPGWSEQGSLFHVVAINSTTANISLRYRTILSNRSLIAVSLSTTKSPKGKRKGIKKPRASPCPPQMAREKPRVQNNPPSPCAMSLLQRNEPGISCMRNNHQTVPTGLPRTTAHQAAACFPAAHFHSVGVQPRSWEPRLLPTCPTCPCAGNEAQSHRLAAEPQMGDAIATGKRCQGCSAPC